MSFTLSTIYKAIDKHTPIIKKMEKANASFAAKQKKMFSQMRNSVANVRNQLIGLAGGLSIASVLMIGSSAITQYDQNLKSLSAITGVAGKGLEQFETVAMRVAQDTKEGAKNILTAFELVGSAKPELLANAKALGEVSRQAIILSKAGKLLPEEAVNALAVSLNQFGAGAEKAAKFTDILATAQQKGSGTIQYLKEAITRSGSTMKTFNVSFEDTVALLEGYAKAGIEASVSGTALSSIMGKLAKAQQKEFNPTYIKAVDIIDNLAKANLSYTQVEKLVGAQQAKNLLALINQNDVVQQLSGNLYEVGNAQSQAAIQTSSFSEKIKQLRARFENLLISGNQNSGALEKLGGVIDFVTKNLDKILATVGIGIGVFASYYAIMTSIRIATVAYNTVLGIMLAFQKSVPISLAANTAAMKVYTAVTKGVTIAIKLLNLAFKATPIGWIAAGIGVVVALFKHMKDRWEGIKKAFKEQGFLGGIKAFGKAILSFILTPIKWILKAIGKLTGAKWANTAVEKISMLDRDLLPDKAVTEEPVNTEKAKIDRYEEITKNQIGIELTNKTDKEANVNYNPALIPVTVDTR